MPSRATRSLAVVVCAVACWMTALVADGPSGAVRAEDRNRDGRPDVWRSFDRHGRIAKISVDTNFDGRSDVEEFYESGTLIVARLIATSTIGSIWDSISIPADAIRLCNRSPMWTPTASLIFSSSFTKVSRYTRNELCGRQQTWYQSPCRPVTAIALRTIPSCRSDDPFSGDLSFKRAQVSGGAPAFAPYVPVGIARHSEERSAFRTISTVAVVDVGALPAAHAVTFSHALLRRFASL